MGFQLNGIDKIRALNAYRRRETSFTLSSYPFVRSTLSNIAYGRRWRNSLVGPETSNLPKDQKQKIIFPEFVVCMNENERNKLVLACFTVRRRFMIYKHLEEEKRHVTLSRASCQSLVAFALRFKPSPPTITQVILSIYSSESVDQSQHPTHSLLNCLYNRTIMWKHTTYGKYRLHHPFPFTHWLKSESHQLRYSTNRRISGTQSEHLHMNQNNGPLKRSPVFFRLTSLPQLSITRTLLLSLSHSSPRASNSSSLPPPLCFSFITQDEGRRLYPILSLSSLHARQ